jgi:quercetin dioxygenase-like cupin family protein
MCLTILDTAVLLSGALWIAFPASAHPPGTPAKGAVRHAHEGEVVRSDDRVLEIFKVTPEQSKALGLATTRFKSLDAGISVHAHEFDDEAFFVHKGAGTFLLGNQRIPIREGDVVFVPRGEWHGFENGSTETFLVWVISASRYLELHRLFFSKAPAPSQAEQDAILQKYGFRTKPTMK